MTSGSGHLLGHREERDTREELRLGLEREELLGGLHIGKLAEDGLLEMGWVGAQRECRGDEVGRCTPSYLDLTERTLNFLDSSLRMRTALTLPYCENQASISV
jgi:hypothetical protein